MKLANFNMRANLTVVHLPQIPVGIACSAPEARVRDTLDTLGLTPTFGAIVTADDVYRGRPDPEAYLLAAQQLGRPPVRCVVVGAFLCRIVRIAVHACESCW